MEHGQELNKGLYRVLARLRRANDLLYSVENALRAFSTLYNKSGERRRREQANVMGIDILLLKGEY